MSSKSPVQTPTPSGSMEPFPEKKESTLKQDDVTPSSPSSSLPRWKSLFQHDVASADWDILLLSTCFKLLLFPA